MVSRADFPSLEDVKQRVINAVCALYRYDRELLDVNANERSITHKLAEYLQHEFPNWNVDCEYNRLGRDAKRLKFNFRSVDPHDIEAKTVFPDIIVHRRRTEENLIVIEVKKANGSADTKDVDKLQTFCKDEGYKYQYGLLLRLGRNGCSKAELYQNGNHTASWAEDIQRALQELGYGE